MKRSLFTQMRTEWRTNIWMIVELSIVGLIVAIITMILSQLFYRHSHPTGYDLSDVYVGSIHQLPEDADNYVEYTDRDQAFNDLDIIVRKLRQNPYVEMVGTGTNAMPYSYNFYGINLFLAQDGDTLAYMGNKRLLSPDLIRLIRLTGPDGATTEQLASAVEKGHLLISPQDDTNYISCDPYKLKGKQVSTPYYSQDGTEISYYISAVCYGIARDDYEGIYGGCIIANPTRDAGLPRQIALRLKPGMGRKFIESLKANDLMQGNVYVNDITSIDDIRDNCQRDINTVERNLVVCALFLLVAVFLGFLGSFWFRTRQRVAEIALRKVNGATRRQIFSRLISEGLILLLVSAVIFTPIYFYVINLDIQINGFSSGAKLPNYIAYAATILILAAMIVAGIWFPARKAMNVQPANALKDQ